MKNWYNSLSQRERMLVSYGSIVVTLILLWLLAAKPLYDKHVKLNTIIASQHNSLATMQKQSIQIKQLQQQGTNKPVVNNSKIHNS